MHVYLKVDVPEPFHNARAGPDQNIRVLVLTARSPCLQQLQKYTTYYINGISNSLGYVCNVCICCTSLLKLSMCRSWIPSSRLHWWAFLDTCRCFSRSARVRELRRRPSTKCVRKNWEYCGSPTSFSHACATQWWSRSAAYESLTAQTYINSFTQLFNLF